jgi:hypothetical protein
MRVLLNTALRLRHSYLRKPLSQCSKIARFSVNLMKRMHRASNDTPNVLAKPLSK